MMRLDRPINILSFNEWKKNSVAIGQSEGRTAIFSLQEKKLFLGGDLSLKKKLEDRNEKGAILLKIYKDNFDWIQEQHQNWLKDQEYYSDFEEGERNTHNSGLLP